MQENCISISPSVTGNWAILPWLTIIKIYSLKNSIKVNSHNWRCIRKQWSYQRKILPLLKGMKTFIIFLSKAILKKQLLKNKRPTAYMVQIIGARSYSISNLFITSVKEKIVLLS